MALHGNIRFECGSIGPIVPQAGTIYLRTEYSLIERNACWLVHPLKVRIGKGEGGGEKEKKKTGVPSYSGAQMYTLSLVLGRCSNTLIKSPQLISMVTTTLAQRVILSCAVYSGTVPGPLQAKLKGGPGYKASEQCTQYYNNNIVQQTCPSFIPRPSY